MLRRKASSLSLTDLVSGAFTGSMGDLLRLSVVVVVDFGISVGLSIPELFNIFVSYALTLSTFLG